MSAYSEDDEDDEYENSVENSDGDPSLASHTQRPKQPRLPTQIRAKSWVLNGEIALALQDKLLTDTMDERLQRRERRGRQRSQLEVASARAAMAARAVAAHLHFLF